MSEFDPAEPPRPEFGQPLRGKTVLVTRARTQSEEITAALETAGAVVIHFPTIEIVPPNSWSSLDASIERISEYDWIVFTSANGVHYFSNRLATLAGDSAVGILASSLICAIGTATARAVQQAGAVPRVIASDSRAEGALEAIIDHLGGEEQLKGLRFLIARARVARETLVAGLRNLGAFVDAVEAYQTVKPEVRPGAVMSLFKETSIDVITFTSSSTVSNFAELAGLTDLSDLLATTLVACIGPVTAETAAGYGLTKVIQPEFYNSAALVDVIIESMARK